MEEGTKLICRKTLIQINKGKAYGRQGKATDGGLCHINFTQTSYIL